MKEKLETSSSVLCNLDNIHRAGQLDYHVLKLCIFVDEIKDKIQTLAYKFWSGQPKALATENAKKNDSVKRSLPL